MQAVNISRELKLAVALSLVCLGMCREALQCCTVKREKDRERSLTVGADSLQYSCCHPMSESV